MCDPVLPGIGDELHDQVLREDEIVTCSGGRSFTPPLNGCQSGADCLAATGYNLPCHNGNCVCDEPVTPSSRPTTAPDPPVPSPSRGPTSPAPSRTRPSPVPNPPSPVPDPPSPLVPDPPSSDQELPPPRATSSPPPASTSNVDEASRVSADSREEEAVGASSSATTVNESLPRVVDNPTRIQDDIQSKEEEERGDNAGLPVGLSIALSFLLAMGWVDLILL